VDDALIRCVNHLGDSDTTGAICGQIVGAFYGYGKIGEKYLRYLERWDKREILLRSAALYGLQFL
jgi:ADP-ribosylglycohydrolase